MTSQSIYRPFPFLAGLASALLIAGAAFAQSTGSIQGTVTDPAGATVPGAQVTIHNQSTDEERNTSTDSAGIYLVPSLAVGRYRVQVKAPGMQPMAASDLDISVGSTVRQDFTLKIASTTEVIEVETSAPVVESTTS